LPRAIRNASAVVFACSVPALVASFSRAGWLSFTCAVATLLVALAVGQYRHAVRRLAAGTLIAAAIAAVTLVPLVPKIRQRLFEAPPELVSARIETVEMALGMWRAHPWTGRGANNYMHTLEREFSIFQGDPYFIPVHNMLVFVMTELGVIGLTVFLCFGVAAGTMNWKVVRASKDPVVQTVAGALLASLVAVFIEGISDPIYVTTVPYFTIWFQLGLGAGLYNMTCGRPQPV
jgi:O-antigen ligase